jgi:hypothetical protein
MAALPDPTRDPTLRPSPDQRPIAPPPAIPPLLADVLQQARAEERSAAGDQRRSAFALTRALLGGARRAGYSAPRLSACLGVSLPSVSTRSGSDGWISAAAITRLADLPPGTVEQWQRAGLLTAANVDQAGQPCYLASELIHALTVHHTG